jgi:hypothetical protein
MKFTYICILMITNLYPDDIQLVKKATSTVFMLSFLSNCMCAKSKQYSSYFYLNVYIH